MVDLRLFFMVKLPATIFIKNSRNMDDIPDKSINLLITSPPYQVDKPYELGMTFDEWFVLMRDVLTESNKKLADSARICINVPSGTGRSPEIPLPKYIIDIALDLGWFMRSWIVWLKPFANTTTAWGSYKSASDPSNRDSHEFILVFNKGSNFKIGPGKSGISGYEFCEFTRSEWIFNPEARFGDHPAPFPDELPRRCILLWSRIGDTVLDPFAGSCTTWKVATALKRKCYCYEKDKSYIPAIVKRISEPLEIQSTSEKARQSMEKIYPGLFDKTTKEMAEMCKKMGIEISKSESKVSMMNEIVKRKKIKSIDEFL